MKKVIINNDCFVFWVLKVKDIVKEYYCKEFMGKIYLRRFK